MRRRKFIEITGKAAVGFPLLNILACSKDNKKTINRWDDYGLEINSPPYFPREYFSGTGTSDSNGCVSFDSGEGTYELTLIAHRDRGEIEGLEAQFYRDSLGECFFLIRDPQRRYMPNLLSPSAQLLGKPSVNGDWQGILEMFLPDEVSVVYNVLVHHLQGDQSWPSWDWSKFDDKPGFIYIGNWSFNDAKYVNSLIRDTSGTITIVAPNQYTAKAWAITATTGRILDSIDKIIDFINENLSFNVDKDVEYPIYIGPPTPELAAASQIVSLASNIIAFTNSIPRNSSERIQDLFPLQPGNSWTYKAGYAQATLRVNEHLKSVKGKDLLVVEGGGLEEYFGFNENTLKYFGFNYPTIGNVLFDPPIVMGDSNVRKGRVYTNSSNIVIEEYPDYAGSLSETLTYEDREDLRNTPLIPFGDCFKARDDVSIDMSYQGREVSDSATAYYWFAKNVGQVRRVIGGTTVDLVDAEFARAGGGRLPANAKDNEVFCNPITHKVLSLLRTLL